jgi:hypothetical protein
MELWLDRPAQETACEFICCSETLAKSTVERIDTASTVQTTALRARLDLLCVYCLWRDAGELALMRASERTRRPRISKVDWQTTKIVKLQLLRPHLFRSQVRDPALARVRSCEAFRARASRVWHSLWVCRCWSLHKHFPVL